MPKPSRSRRRGLLALICLAVQPLYLVVELVVTTAATAPLGATACTNVDYRFGPVAVCSPAHSALNAVTVLFGVLLIIGAIAVRPWLARRRLALVAVLLWCIAAISAIGAGLVPLNENLELHVLVALPGLLVQPAALIVTAIALERRSWARLSALVLGLISGAASRTLLFWPYAQYGGLLERIALWPVYLWLPVLGVMARTHQPHQMTEPLNS